MTYKFLGQKVCMRGFQALTHIGSSSLKRTIPDLFGAWVPLDDITMKAAVELEMPDCILSPSDVLIPNILLSADGTIPYCILDELRSQHDIDVSGLQVSRTQNGNIYRSHVLSRAYG